MSKINLDDFRIEISKASYDSDNKEYMTESDLIVYDFDKIKDHFTSSLGMREEPAPKSNDAFYIDRTGEKYYFIEFKNGTLNKQECYELMQKNYDSTIILSRIMCEDLEMLKNKLTYILVYNESKNPCEEGRLVQESPSRVGIGSSFARKAAVRFYRFQQGFFENYLFSKVYTITVEEFLEEFIFTWENNI